MGVELPLADVVRNSTDLLLVVRVVAVDRPAATQGNPPLLQLVVDEVLRGDALQGAQLQSLWPAWSDSFYAARSGGAELERWNEAPLPVPAVDSCWVVMGARFSPAPQDDGAPLPPGITDGRSPAAFAIGVPALLLHPRLRLEATAGRLAEVRGWLQHPQ